MNRLLLLLVSLFLASCTNEQDCGCTYYDMRLTIAVKDAEGNSLINESNYNDIEIRYLINGISRDGRMPIFINDEYGPRIGISLNNDKSDALPITYIIWNDNDTDTIKAAYRRGYHQIDKVWLNEQLIDRHESPGYFYTLVK